jgi:hypothetical protein
MYVSSSFWKSPVVNVVLHVTDMVLQVTVMMLQMKAKCHLRSRGCTYPAASGIKTKG